MSDKKSKKIMTLCIIHDHPRVLLGMKKRGFGANRWNGFGGKVEEGESIEDAARREILEEAGIKVREISKLGVLEFEFKETSEICEVHIFKSNAFSGEPRESDEMIPKWFNVDEIPFAEMWKDDPFWFPFFLSNRKFKGRFLFGPEDAILDYAVSAIQDSELR